MNVLPIFFLVLLSLTVLGFLAYHLFYMPEFFERMPKKEEFRKKGNYEIYTFRTGPGEGRVFGERYHGGHTDGKAYLWREGVISCLRCAATTDNL